VTTYGHTTRLQRWYERLTLLRAVTSIIVVALLLVLLAGLLARLVEPETYTSIGLAYWWAVTTVTTVGYGDVVPTTPAGRAVGAALMLTGLSLIPTLTSVTVTLLISKRKRVDEERIAQLESQQATVLTQIEQRLARIEQAR
jgi:voltage-gated potassium channel